MYLSSIFKFMIPINSRNDIWNEIYVLQKLTSAAATPPVDDSKDLAGEYDDRRSPTSVPLIMSENRIICSLLYQELINILVLMKDDFVTIGLVFGFFDRVFIWNCCCCWLFRFISPIIDDFEFRRDSLFNRSFLFYLWK
jgi:hypothetical protein